MTAPTATSPPLTDGQLAAWDRDGFVIAPGLFRPAEVDEIRDAYDDLAARGEPVDGYWRPDLSTGDPLQRYPRAMHPHRWSELGQRHMLKPEVGAALAQLMGEPAVACQSMYYYKPPGSPGQSLHQDNFYLAVKPATCIAAWTAIDPADEHNGGLYVVPGTHRMDIHCPDMSEVERAKTTNLVDPPKGMRAVPTRLHPGDTLFFNGSLIHGSGRNKTADRWRRSFICHYMPRSSTHVNAHYFPLLDFDGQELTYEAAAAGGPCGYGDDVLVPNSYGVDATIP